MNKVLIPSRTFFRIGDVAEIIGVKPYVIRFWEGEFPFVAPDKASSGQRVYRRSQIEALILVKQLLHVERYSIEGAKKKLTELRKQAKLKEAMLSLIANESVEFEGEAPVELKVGSKVPKDKISSLEEKLQDLQNLIRDSNVPGLDGSNLKSK